MGKCENGCTPSLSHFLNSALSRSHISTFPHYIRPSTQKKKNRPRFPGDGFFLGTLPESNEDRFRLQDDGRGSDAGGPDASNPDAARPDAARPDASNPDAISNSPDARIASSAHVLEFLLGQLNASIDVLVHRSVPFVKRFVIARPP